MKLWSRTLVLRADAAETLELARETTSLAYAVTGKPLRAWQIGLGAPFGSLGFTMAVSGLAEMAASTTALTTDERMADVAGRLRSHYVQSPVDELLSPVFGEVSEEPPPLGTVATLTRATMMTGRRDAAIGLGVELCEQAQKVAEVLMVFGPTDFGPAGEVIWIAFATDAAATDAAMTALRGDRHYQELVGQTDGLFLPGSGHSMMATRIA